MNNSAIPYWEIRFTEGAKHHSNQNEQISVDFLKTISNNCENIIQSASSILEVGCGTGELTKMVSNKYKKKVVGTDFSAEAINFATNNYSSDLVNYHIFDALNQNIDKKYDLCICSNTLEHFKNPYIVIDKILKNCEFIIILVPFEQPNTDGYEFEGGAGHVFEFNVKSFDRYKILEHYTFSTAGWQHSSNGEIPLQLVVILQK